jgi:hypothetical protein
VLLLCSNSSRKWAIDILNNQHEKLSSNLEANKVTTAGEDLLFDNDPKTRHVRESPDSPRPKKARMSHSEVMTLLICFFDGNDSLSLYQTANQKFYAQVLERLRKWVSGQNFSSTSESSTVTRRPLIQRFP